MKLLHIQDSLKSENNIKKTYPVWLQDNGKIMLLDENQLPIDQRALIQSRVALTFLMPVQVPATYLFYHISVF